MKLHTYLNYGGNCEQAFRFYEQHLGGKITMLMRWKDQPEPKNVPPGMEDKVVHVRMDLAGTELLGSDVPDRWQPMRSAYLSLEVDTPEAERIWKVLCEGAEIFMPLQETFFAHRFAMLRDKFGTSWMIIHPRPLR